MAKKCKTCGWIGKAVSVTQEPPDWSAELPPEVKKLEKVTGNIHQCPKCDDLFRFEREKDSDHFQGNTRETMRRMPPREALDRLLDSHYDGPLLAELEAVLK